MLNTKFHTFLKEDEKKHQTLMYKLGIYKFPELTVAPSFIYNSFITPSFDTIKSYMNKRLDEHNKRYHEIIIKLKELKTKT